MRGLVLFNILMFQDERLGLGCGGHKLTPYETRRLSPGEEFSVKNFGGKIHVGSVHTPAITGVRPATIARNSGEGYYKEN